MKYVLMIYVDPTVMDELSDDARQELERTHQQFQADVRDSGEMLATHRLGDPALTTVIRSVDGRPEITDGPYPELKEFIGGYYLLDVESPDRAAKLAQQLPEVRIDGCSIEVRPVMYSAGVDL